MTFGSVISAIARSCAPHQGHSFKSIETIRFRRYIQVIRKRSAKCGVVRRIR